MKRLVCVAMIACLLVSIIGCSASSSGSTTAASTGAESSRQIPDEIKIGIAGTLSGDHAYSGKAMVDAAMLVAKELEAQGGLEVEGKKVKITFVSEDTESKPEIAVNAIQKLIEQDGVLAIVGPENSSDVLSSGAISQSAKIPQITHVGTNIKVTQMGDFIFRMCYTDPYQGQIAAKFSAEELKAKKVAVLWNVADAYSEGLHESFAAACDTYGIEIVADQSFSGIEIKDYNAQLTIIKGANPDVIFLPNDINTVPLIMQQGRSLGITAPFLGGDAWDYAQLPELAGFDNCDGSYYVTGFSSEIETAKQFCKDFEELAGYRASFASAMCYESIYVILDAIQNAATIDGQGIRDAMAKADLNTITGHITFDDERNAKQNAVILKFNKGIPEYYMNIGL